MPSRIFFHLVLNPVATLTIQQLFEISCPYILLENDVLLICNLKACWVTENHPPLLFASLCTRREMTDFWLWKSSQHTSKVDLALSIARPQGSGCMFHCYETKKEVDVGAVFSVRPQHQSVVRVHRLGWETGHISFGAYTKVTCHRENDLTGITWDQATCLGLIPVDWDSGHPGPWADRVITIHSSVDDAMNAKKGSQLDTSSNKVVLSQLN